MKASELILYIRENLKDYPIEYLKNKAQDDRYPDSITKRLAIYNSSIYDEIFDKEIEDVIHMMMKTGILQEIYVYIFP